MAHKRVGARTEGDVFQGLFFWRHAAALLNPESRVQRVEIEHDEAVGVDDVAVFYRHPGVDAGGWMSTADFYQVKYHIDRRDAYSSDAIIDPAFINAKSSLLQRFYVAYLRLKEKHSGFRLHLASNWRWRDDDGLAGVLREYDGALPDEFFSSGSRSELGKIREKWRAHLSLPQEDFGRFGRTLRLQLDHFGRRDFREMVHDHLARVGLIPPDDSDSSSRYESLVQQFLMNGPNSFDRNALREICEREGLLKSDASPAKRVPAIGLRSFVRFAERLEDETDAFVCVARHFEGRQPRDVSSWSSAAQAVVAFLSDPCRRARLRVEEHAIVLECHGTLAILAGYEMSRNSGCRVYPLQKPLRELWKPVSHPSDSSAGGWVQDRLPRDEDARDCAIALSVTHGISEEVGRYLETKGAPHVHSLLSLQPSAGVGPDVVRGPDHASQLVAALIPVFSDARRVPRARVHLFTSAPNSLLFILGQFREALGRVVLYEYDFAFERHCTYEPSITLPISVAPATLEVHDGTQL